MAQILFSHYLYPWYDIQQERQAGKIRLSIFLIAAECFGLPALVWALRVLYGHHKSGGRISALVIMLLLCDLLELFLNPYIVTKLLQDDYCWDKSMTCWIFTSLWSGSNFCGFLLQHTVALEVTVSLRHPVCSAYVFFPFCSIVIFTIAFIFFFLCELLMPMIHLILSIPFFLVITLVSCTVTCRAPPQISDMPIVLAFVTFAVMLHEIFIIISTVLQRYWDLWVMDFCLISFRVITDPLLCMLVYRKDLGAQTPQTHTQIRKSEMNS